MSDFPCNCQPGNFCQQCPKPMEGSVYPVGSLKSSGWGDCGPVVTPQEIRDQFLWGIPLVSPQKDPSTGKPWIMSDATIYKCIERAIAIIEAKGFGILPQVQTWKGPWDFLLFQRQQFMIIPGLRPISSLISLSIELASGGPLFTFPNGWIDSDRLYYGQISLTPIGVGSFGTGFAGVSQNGIGGGIWYLGNGLSGTPWAPSYWKCIYTSGFPGGQIPTIFNEAIALKASCLILQQLQATRALVNSQSLGLDGMSSSQSGPGNQSYGPAIAIMEKQYTDIMNRLKSLFGLSMFASDVG